MRRLYERIDMKQMTELEKSRPITVSIPYYMQLYMKMHFSHGEASKILFDGVKARMANDNINIEDIKDDN